MRRLCACFLLLGLIPAVFADGPTLKEARQRWLKGQYVDAQTMYENLAKDKETAVAATIGLSRVLHSQGEYEKAQTVVEKLLKGNEENADLLARHAEQLYFRGRHDDAMKTAEKAIGIEKDHFLARWIRAQIYRDTGEMKKADTECRWFVRIYTQRDQDDKPIKDPDELLIVGQAGTENARWHKLTDQFSFILNEVYRDALRAEREFWFAEYFSGTLLLEKYNRGEALDSFDKALKINPRCAEALVGKGIAALQRFEIKAAEQFAEQALKINPRLPEGLRLRADMHLMGGDLNAAMKDLEAARVINPRDEETLGQIAAVFHVRKDKKGFQKIVTEAETNNPVCGLFYYRLAERLDHRKLYDDAEGFYKKSSELLPQVPWAKNSLGMLYMRMGREDEAKKILTAAFEADRFNVLVSNTLKVLRHLEKYETIKTDHFELRYDPKSDQVLARYMAEYLEEIYQDLAKQFQYQPKGPILVEVFNNHEMFSGRTIALPDLHTIGACTGRMFAMVSPRGKGIPKPFNWGRVLRHELVHIFNLEQTNFQVPHWFTEGLAVMNEGYPRPQQWNQLLVERVPRGELMNLDNIDLSFIRPKSPLDWSMAYCQSHLYVEYMKDKYGPKTIGQLLEAYRESMETGAAIQKVCKVDKATFEKGYRDYLQAVAAKIKGKPAEKPMTLKELEAAYDQNPDDAEVGARLAEQYLNRRRKVDARKIVDKILAKNEGHGMASYVKARLLLDAGDEDEARKLLETAAKATTTEPNVLLTLGKIYFEAREFDKAASTYELGRKAEPFNSRWLAELSRVYSQSGDKAKLIDILKELVPTDADELDLRKRLAKLLLEDNRFAEADTYARQALQIDVLDAEAQDTLLKALEGQKKTDEAAKFRKLLGR